MSVPPFKVISLLLILLLGVIWAAAQDEDHLTSDDVRQFEPVAILGGRNDLAYEFRAVSLNSWTFQLQLFNVADDSLIYDFGITSYYTLINDNLLLWFGDPQTQAPRLYSLPEAEELGRFPLGANVQPRQKGEGFFYVSGSSVFFQPLDMTEPPVTLADDMGYTQRYSGALEELPDGRTVLIAGQSQTILYDLEAHSVSGEITYLFVQSVTFSADGARLSAITNYDASSSRASNWLAYDLTENRALVELYGERGAHGTISASGKYGAASQLVTDSLVAVLHVYDLDSGEVLFRTENVLHGSGMPGHNAFLFVEDRLAFVRNWNGQSGFLSIYDPASGEVTDTQIPAAYIADAVYRWYRIPVLSDTTSMIQVNALGVFSIFDLDSMEVVRSFPSLARYGVHNRGLVIYLGRTGILFATPDDEHPAMPTLSGTTRSQNINVRALPSIDGERLASASGEVLAIGRNANSTWLLLLSHGGWVSADLITLDGDVELLTVVP